LMKCGVQCSRGSRDDRSERAPSLFSCRRSWLAPKGAGHTGSARWLSSRQLEEKLAATAARLHRRALEISFVARRGEHPKVLEGLDQGALRWDRSLHRDRESVWQRSRSHSRSSRSLRSGRGVQVAAGARNSRPRGSCPTERAPQGCSRIRREIPSGRTGRIALSSECSYRFVVCMFRVMASRPSLSGRGARCARGQRVPTHSSSRGTLKWMRQSSSKNQGQNLGMGSCHDRLRKRATACR
jgi:hypothetical protein